MAAAVSPADASSPMEMSGDPSPDANASPTNTPATSTPRDSIIAMAVPGISRSASGATVIDPSVEPSATLNPRSCVTCRRRKVRCDKHMPCGNCRKARISCIFPAPGRAPRRPRPRDPNAPPKQTSEREAELIKRLRKLEGIVEELSGQIEVEGRPSGSGTGESPETTVDDHERKRGGSATAPPSNSASPDGLPMLASAPVRLSTSTRSTSVQSPTMSVNKDFGKLVLNNQGKTRYVSNAFFSRMNDELAQLRVDTQRLSDGDSAGSDDEGSSPETERSDKDNLSDHHAFVMGYRSADVDLRKLHPLPSQIPFIWQIYIENVDPLIKLLHIPTMNSIIRKIRSDMDSMTPGLEALMFAIYYAAITSLEEDEVKTNFGADKSYLIKQYRYGTEQALAKANFLNTSELVVVQAFTLFLALVRRYDDTRFSWTLTGLLIRISQSIGTHREGTQLGSLTPFEIEMRRRLWWAICILDLRSAEDQGTELTIAEHTFDTQYPMNVNDSDLSPDMKEFPRERVGATDMTFSLIRYEICSLARRLHAATNPMSPWPKDSGLTMEQREQMLGEMFARVEYKYLKPCTDQDGDLLHWVAAAIARLIMAKMSLIIYQPVLFASAGQDVSQEVRDRLFTSSTEVIEYNRLLNTEPRCKQYRWLFETYTQWHAVAFLLLEVCRRPWSSSVERAWVALSNVFSDVKTHEYQRLTQYGAVWLPLRKLMIKAKRHRESELARLQANPEAARKLDSNMARTPPANFRHLPSSMRETISKDRWRKLVGIEVPDRRPRNGCYDDHATMLQQQMPNLQSQPHMAQMSQTELDYIGSIMAQQSFNPTDFWTVACSGAELGDAARQAIVGSNPAAQQLLDQTQQQMASRMPASNCLLDNKNGVMFPRDGNSTTASVPPQVPTTSPLGMPQSSTVLSAATGMVDENPPPWLWSNAWKWNDQDTAANMPAGVDDGDMNMEEDFNWQDWQQSIRGFELDAGLGMGLSGGGFSGGV